MTAKRQAVLRTADERGFQCACFSPDNERSKVCRPSATRRFGAGPSNKSKSNANPRCRLGNSRLVNIPRAADRPGQCSWGESPTAWVICRSAPQMSRKACRQSLIAPLRWRHPSARWRCACLARVSPGAAHGSWLGEGVGYFTHGGAPKSGVMAPAYLVCRHPVRDFSH